MDATDAIDAIDAFVPLPTPEFIAQVSRLARQADSYGRKSEIESDACGQASGETASAARRICRD